MSINNIIEQISERKDVQADSTLYYNTGYRQLPIEFYKKYSVVRLAKLAALNMYCGKLRNMENYHTILTRYEDIAVKYTEYNAKKYNIDVDWNSAVFIDLYHSSTAKLLNYIEHEKVNQNMTDAEILTILKDYTWNVYTEQYHSTLDKINQAKNTNVVLRYSTLYTCPKCGESKSRIENLTNRSADEGTSLRVTCIECGFGRNDQA